MHISRHAARRFTERVHAPPDLYATLEGLYWRSRPATWIQRAGFGIVEDQPDTAYLRALYYHPDKRSQIEVLLIVRDDWIITVLIRTQKQIRSRAQHKRTRLR